MTFPVIPAKAGIQVPLEADIASILGFSLRQSDETGLLSCLIIKCQHYLGYIRGLEIYLLIWGVNGSDILGHLGVAVHRIRLHDWPGIMSIRVVSDGIRSAATRARASGGLSASMYFFAVLLWMPNSRATPRIDSPLRFAFCTALHVAI